MQVDAQTFRDLEIFATGVTPGLFELLDRTRTVGGRDALLRRFRRPLSSSAEIRVVQDALKFIHAHRTGFELLPADNLVRPVRAYLSANFTGIAHTGPAASMEALWLSVRYHDIHRELSAGVKATRVLVRSLHRFLGQFEEIDLPPALDALTSTLRDALGSAPLDWLARYAKAGPIALYQRDRELRLTHRRDVERVIDVVHQIDALMSMASATAERGLHFPQVDDTAEGIDIGDAAHPFLASAVPNDLRLAADQNVLFLTGPNMAGKTTYLKTCGVVVYLAHLGMGVPARRARLAPFGCLFSGIHTTDNLREGTSYFLAEARRVKQLATVLHGGTRAFVLFDEIFKGTNVKDAMDACDAVIDGLTRADASVSLVSSHLLELVPELEGNSRIAFGYFDADTATRDLRYDYRLKPGHSQQRLGMRVLAQEGVLQLFNALPDSHTAANGIR